MRRIAYRFEHLWKREKKRTNKIKWRKEKFGTLGLHFECMWLYMQLSIEDTESKTTATRKASELEMKVLPVTFFYTSIGTPN